MVRHAHPVWNYISFLNIKETMKNNIEKFGEKDKALRFIGAGLLCVASLCIIWGDKTNNLTILKFGKITAIVGVILYFSDRIKKLF